MKNHIFFVLILCCLMQISCKKTEGFLFLGDAVSEKFVGTYHGLAEESLEYTETRTSPVLSAYKASVDIETVSNCMLAIRITLCKANSDGKVVLDLQADVDVDSDDARIFVIQPENFPTTIFGDRKVFINEGDGELDVRTENLELRFTMVTESSSVAPDSNTLNTRAQIMITTDAKGTGSSGC